MATALDVIVVVLLALPRKPPYLSPETKFQKSNEILFWH